jgi:hypothetical protein
MSSSMMSTLLTLCRAKSAQSAIVLGGWHDIGRLRSEIDSFMGHRGTYPRIGIFLCQGRFCGLSRQNEKPQFADKVVESSRHWVRSA